MAGRRHAQGKTANAWSWLLPDIYATGVALRNVKGVLSLELQCETSQKRNVIKGDRGTQYSSSPETHKDVLLWRVAPL